MNADHKVTLFVVNDFLSKLEPFRPFVPGEGVSESMGGLARIGHVLRKASEDSPGQVLSFVAGLDFSGPVAELFKGEAEMVSLEAAGFSAAVPGIHEFEYGPAKAGAMLRRTSLPILSANLKAIHESLSGIFVPHAVYNTSLARVGVFGLSMVAPTSIMSDGPSLESGDYKDCAESAVRALREEGCDIIVAVTHVGLAADTEVASQVSGIHAIFGAHSHSITREPVIVDGPDGWRTLVMQAGTGGALLGRLDLFVQKGEVNESASRWTLIPMGRDVPEVRRVAETVRPYIEGVRSHLGSSVAKLTIDLDGRLESMLAGTSTLGNLVADAFRWRAGADVGLVSASLIQGNGYIEAGRVSLGQLYGVLPFSNSLFRYSVTGEELLEILNLSAQALTVVEPDEPDPTCLTRRSFLQVSGMRLELSAAGALLSAKVETDGILNEVDPAASYSMAGPSWFCHGGDGYEMLGRVTSWNTGCHDVEALAGYLRSGYESGSERITRVFLVD